MRGANEVRMAVRRFQVYGQRCSGTNALIKLIEKHFGALQFTEEFGFKHWLVPEDVRIPSDVIVLVIAREVGQWLRSLHKNPWHAHPELKAVDFSAFIRAEWRSIWDEDFWGMDAGHPLFGKPIAEEMCPRTRKPFPNALAMRTAKLANWLDLAQSAENSLIVSHDVLVNNASRLIDMFEEKSGCRRSRPFEPLTTYKGQGESSFKPKRYADMNEADSRFVASNTDPLIENLFLRVG